MKNFKKILTEIIALVIVFALIGCSSIKNSQHSNDVNENVDEESDDVVENKDDNHNILVVYYSATGSTRRVAEEIAGNLNAEIFEMEPEEIYTSEDLDWTNNDSRVTREHEDETLRDIPLKNTNVEGWDSYDVILIGYPIWWGIAAWPVDNFVKENDFTNKIVIPFCTSASSGMGQSKEILENYAGTGDWLDGQRFSSNASVDDVKVWTDSLNLK